MEIVLFGASVRSLASSVLAGGDQPIAVDLFADWDLQQRCPTHRLDLGEYPDGFLRHRRLIDGRPWMFTGGLENYPSLIDALGEAGPLWGIGAESLRRVRDPLLLARELRDAGFEPPEAADSPAGLPLDGTWLVKPKGGAGGRGVRPWRGGEPPVNSYWQRRAEGESFGAIFIGEGGRAGLLGASRQWTGLTACNAPCYAYCGSIGPWPTSDGVKRILGRLGNELARRFDLRGLFGVDYLQEEDRIQPIEVNPRYTASIEVLEHATGQSAHGLHRSVFLGQGLTGDWASVRRPGFVAKAILFARCAGRLSAEAACHRHFSPGADCWFADVPFPGAEFGRGDPILTVLARGQSIDEAQRRLWEAAGRFERDDLEYKS